MRPLKIAISCKSGRLDALRQAVMSSAYSPEVFALSDTNNPRLTDPRHFYWGKTDDPAFVKKCIREIRPDLYIIGPEEPLAAAIADLLAAEGIPCVGPTQSLARLESSKAFTRQLMKRHKIPGSPDYEVFTSVDGIADYLKCKSEFVIKPDGLTGGKGVKVSGEHIHSLAEALAYCSELFDSGQRAILIEEKLDGEEFSFQSFFDGKHIAHTIPVQDHKRVLAGDKGPNTGGMGSYSCADHLLPFLNEGEVRQAAEINRRVGEALLEETGEAYKGILYGGFMLTKNGLKVIEFNARFGDPEVMNVLPIMETDFVDVCLAIVNGTLGKINVRFQKRATVCKYLVPKEYPRPSPSYGEIDVTALDHMASSEPNLRVFYGAVERGQKGLRLTGSRAIGVVGIGESLIDAELIAEKAASLVKGPVHHRKDIGTAKLINKRVNHMRLIRESSVPEHRTKLAS